MAKLRWTSEHALTVINRKIWTELLELKHPARALLFRIEHSAEEVPQHCVAVNDLALTIAVKGVDPFGHVLLPHCCQCQHTYISHPPCLRAHSRKSTQRGPTSPLLVALPVGIHWLPHDDSIKQSVDCSCGGHRSRRMY